MAKVRTYTNSPEPRFVARAKYTASGKDIDLIDGEVPVIETGDAGKVLSVKSDESGTEWKNLEAVKTQSDGGATSIIMKFWKGTQAQYDAIVTPDANTFYIIVG